MYTCWISSASRCQGKCDWNFGAVVGLNDVDPERESTDDLVHEGNRRRLVAGVVHLEHANSGTVIDGGELIEPLACTGNAFEKLDVHLQSMTRLRLLVPKPAFRMRPVFLIRRQPIHAVTLQDPMHGRHGDGDRVKPLKVIRNAPGPEVVVLSQIQDLADDIPREGGRRP
jgi:hypothetical protein